MGFSNKRGQTVFDTIMVIIVLFILALAAIIGSIVFSGVNDDVQADTTLSNQTKTTMSTINDNYTNWFDAAILGALIFFWALLLITSFLIDTHPVFFIVTVLLLMAVFVVSMIISNAYVEITTDSDMSAFSVQFPLTNFIMNNLLIIIIVIGLSTGVALYAKFQ